MCLGGIFETLIQVLNVIFTHFPHQSPHGTALLQPLAKEFHKQIIALTKKKRVLRFKERSSFQSPLTKVNMRTFTASQVPKEFRQWQQEITLSTGIQRLYVPHWPVGVFIFNKRKFLSAQKHGERAMHHANFQENIEMFSGLKGWLHFAQQISWMIKNLLAFQSEGKVKYIVLYII